MTARPVAALLLVVAVALSGCSEAEPGVAQISELHVLTDPPEGFVETYRGELRSLEGRGPSGVVYHFGDDGDGEPNEVEFAAAVARREPWRVNVIHCPEHRLNSDLGYAIELGAEIDGNYYTMELSRSSAGGDVSALVRGRQGESPWTNVRVFCANLDDVPAELEDAVDRWGPPDLVSSTG